MAEPNKSGDVFVLILIPNLLEVGMESHKGMKGRVFEFSVSKLQFCRVNIFLFSPFTSLCFKPAIWSQKGLQNTSLQLL
jgi:hypothetical protein